MSNVQTYFSLTDQDKIDALETAASKLGRPADLLEKDIWVVWSLNALFDSTLGESLVSKAAHRCRKSTKRSTGFLKMSMSPTTFVKSFRTLSLIRTSPIHPIAHKRKNGLKPSKTDWRAG